MAQIDERGRAYTDNQTEARQYRLEDRQINYHAIKNNYNPPKKWVNFTTEVKHFGNLKRYYLPPSQGQGGIYKNNPYISVQSGRSLQEHQTKAMAFIAQQRAARKRSAMIVSGTASGKSRMILGTIDLLRLKTVIVVPTLVIGK